MLKIVIAILIGMGTCAGWLLGGPAVGFIVFAISMTIVMVRSLGSAQRPKDNDRQINNKDE